MKAASLQPKATIRKGWLRREAIIAARFGLIGVVATIAHILLVSILIYETRIPVIISNTIAFLFAFSISFTGNYIWTFRSPGRPYRTMRRFLLISASAFLINTIIFSIILANKWLSPIYGAISSASVVPLITYLASRLWVFQNTEHRSSNTIATS